MAKAKKDKNGKNKPEVEVQDLTPEQDPKGGFSWGETNQVKADASGLKAGGTNKAAGK